MARYLLKVPDISCNHCKMRIQKALEEIGEKDFEVKVAEKEVIIDTENIEKVVKKLEEIDYPVEQAIIQ
ncbi:MULTISPECIES: heavy-metal-associated domain-containing protein [Fervidobacterium]|uniref:Heavy metal transport/detoxification protein n=1 Tax=Fervidobacterium nodosum (strain ATCC 35602 / DSM 5306 / Rt17-B1) TaxID=381764 RepID=A7HMR0_FERNB|nr:MULTISPECIES: heavy-metal-associated domain-containing protein [Fervidobacterium]PHJ13558.1 copper resistance protein CopZ [Fervidobacterium sp. SC_NGM5_G05]HOJ94738.1 heavy-metal-associated domain-containing protein [Fervidobacterium nodosum]ABS61193.1 Heavy metal transport/detoxification protein [Fervidobacterium nodosum Rt17-B1]KAF2961104.1 copper resistance protein CopZ [Fervidobacterium sp. 2310opik-2]NPU90032.1 heavy-metal-associated domain-containing protein [Fervidobacterium sp.]